MSLLYTPVFCFRRLLLVCAFLALQSHSFWVILTFNAIQSFNFWYISHARPHADRVHNILENFNEICLIVLQYTMLFFLPGSTVQPQAQWQLGNFSMALLALVFVVNITALVVLTIMKLMFWLKVRRARKLRAKVLSLRRQLQEKKKQQQLLDPVQESNPLDEARNMSKIVEDRSESDLSLRDPIKKLFVVDAQESEAVKSQADEGEHWQDFRLFRHRREAPTIDEVLSNAMDQVTTLDVHTSAKIPVPKVMSTGSRLNEGREDMLEEMKYNDEANNCVLSDALDRRTRLTENSPSDIFSHKTSVGHRCLTELELCY